MQSSESRPSAPGPGQAEARPHDSHTVCPSCGQHVDAANIRCPRCRLWFVVPPARRRWSRLAVAAAMLGLALGGFGAGLVMQRIWQPLPLGVVVPPDAANAPRR